MPHLSQIPRRWMIGLALLLSGISASATLASAAQTKAGGTTDISASAAQLFPEIDRRAALSDLKPLRSETLAEGDLEVRVWGNLVDGREGSYVFRRQGGVWSGLELLPVRPETEVCHYKRQLPTPATGWDMFWIDLQTDDIRTIQNTIPPTMGPKLTLRQAPSGDIFHLVEIREGMTYRAYTHFDAYSHEGPTGVGVITQAALGHFDFAENVTIAPLAPEAQQYLLHGDFKEYHDVAQIPADVRATLRGCGWAVPEDMANPGQEWQATDVGHKRLPHMRLIFVAVSQKYCLLAHESGGRGYGLAAILLRRSANRAAVIEGCANITERHDGGLPDLASVRGQAQAIAPFGVNEYLP